MAVEIPKTSYSGKIKEIKLGKGNKALTVGGETSYPFYLFEGELPNTPRIAMEVWDCPPEDWAEAALEPFSGVTDDPVAWAKKCVDDYGAEMITLQLTSIDPKLKDTPPKEAAKTVEDVLQAVDVPLAVGGCGDPVKEPPEGPESPFQARSAARSGQQAHDARGAVDLDALAVLEPGRQLVDAHDARPAVLARDDRAVLQDAADL